VSEQLLTILKYFLIALIWLFFLRVTRSAWVEVRRPRVWAAGKGISTAAERPSEENPRQARTAAPWYLSVVEPKELEGTRFELDGEMTIGRAEGCAICLPNDNYASHLHTRVYLRDGLPYLEDLGSTNGTWVNSSQVDAPVALVVRDRVKIGMTVIEVSR